VGSLVNRQPAYVRESVGLPLLNMEE
jgi:hypothetical protein